MERKATRWSLWEVFPSPSPAVPSPEGCQQCACGCCPQASCWHSCSVPVHPLSVFRTKSPQTVGAFSIRTAFFIKTFVNLMFFLHHGVVTAIKFSIREKKKYMKKHCLKHKKQHKNANRAGSETQLKLSWDRSGLPLSKHWLHGHRRLSRLSISPGGAEECHKYPLHLGGK